MGSRVVIAAFTVVSRLSTTFLPLYLMKQGLRASLLPAINLAQISEFSLVVIQTGLIAEHIQSETASAASFAFVVLAVLSTFAIGRSDQLSRHGIDVPANGSAFAISTASRRGRVGMAQDTVSRDALSFSDFSVPPARC